MKKLTTSIILSLALTIVFAVSALALINPNSTIYPRASAESVRYVVAVLTPQETVQCGHYMVMVVDEAGQPVAPPQSFVPGTVSYIFNEATYSFIGERTARMIYVQEDGPVCKQQLMTKPASNYNFFKTGQSYYFELHPVNRPKPQN